MFKGKKSLSLYVKHIFVKSIYSWESTHVVASNALRLILTDIDLAGLEYLVVIRLMFDTVA